MKNATSNTTFRAGVGAVIINEEGLVLGLERRDIPDITFSFLLWGYPKLSFTKKYRAFAKFVLCQVLLQFFVIQIQEITFSTLGNCLQSHR